MRGFLSSLMIATLLLSFTPAYVFAAESDNSYTSTNQMYRDEMVHELRLKIKDYGSAVAAKLSKDRMQITLMYWQNLSSRLSDLILRLEKLTDRISTRIAKIEAENTTVKLTDTKKALQSAQDKLASAKAKLAAADLTMQDVVNSSDPKAAFSVVKNTVKDIKADLTDVRKSLIKIVTTLKGLRVGTTKQTVTVTLAPTI